VNLYRVVTANPLKVVSAGNKKKEDERKLKKDILDCIKKIEHKMM